MNGRLTPPLTCRGAGLGHPARRSSWARTRPALPRLVSLDEDRGPRAEVGGRTPGDEEAAADPIQRQQMRRVMGAARRVPAGTAPSSLSPLKPAQHRRSCTSPAGRHRASAAREQDVSRRLAPAPRRKGSDGARGRVVLRPQARSRARPDGDHAGAPGMPRRLPEAGGPAAAGGMRRRRNGGARTRSGVRKRTEGPHPASSRPRRSRGRGRCASPRWTIRIPTVSLVSWQRDGDGEGVRLRSPAFPRETVRSGKSPERGRRWEHPFWVRGGKRRASG